jgi:hypothetical protein
MPKETGKDGDNDRQRKKPRRTKEVWVFFEKEFDVEFVVSVSGKNVTDYA